MAEVTDNGRERPDREITDPPYDLTSSVGGTVIIRTKDPGPKLVVRAWIGEDGPNVTGGYGGWEMVTRPRRIAITQWRGREPIQMDLPIIIDGYDGSETGDGSRRITDSVELVITDLERMALPWQGMPPRVSVRGNSTNLVPHDDLTWVIVQLAWGAALRSSSGNRIRQEATIGLLSYIKAEKVKLRAAELQRMKAGR